jgi:hypothetical protein
VRPTTNAGAPRGGTGFEGGLGARNALERRGTSVGARPNGEAGAASAGPTLCHCTPAWTPKTPKIRIEVHKVVNRKVVDLTILYNFYKGSRVFFSTDFAQSAVKL